MRGKLLRIPGPSFPAEVRTEDAILDDYLERLDALLVGGEKVRELVLLEARDHLLEARDRRRASGEDAEAAAQSALASFGEPEAHAAPQRRRRWRRFWGAAFLTGPMFGAANTFLMSLDGAWPSGIGVVIAALVQAIVFGAAMGWFLAFAHAEHAVPDGTDSGDESLVSYSRRQRAWSWGFLVAFALLAVVSAADLAGRGLLFSTSLAGVLLPLAMFDVFVFYKGLTRFRVDRRGFWIDRPLGRTRVDWAQICAVERLAERHRWIPRASDWSRAYAIAFAYGARVRRVHIPADIGNGDRLVVAATDALHRE